MKYDVQKLREARERKGWDLTTVAFKCGVSASAISYTERGERTSVKLILKMAKVLRVKRTDIEIAA